MSSPRDKTRTTRQPRTVMPADWRFAVGLLCIVGCAGIILLGSALLCPHAPKCGNVCSNDVPGCPSDVGTLLLISAALVPLLAGIALILSGERRALRRETEPEGGRPHDDGPV